MPEAKQTLTLEQASIAFNISWALTALPALFFNAAFSSPDQEPKPIFSQSAEFAIKNFSLAKNILFSEDYIQLDFLKSIAEVIQCLKALIFWQNSGSHASFHKSYEDNVLNRPHINDSDLSDDMRGFLETNVNLSQSLDQFIFETRNELIGFGEHSRATSATLFLPEVLQVRAAQLSEDGRTERLWATPRPSRAASHRPMKAAA